ncbi:hypothetical protein Dsin_029068 [Dipteronia sinensis]|uniref:MULE transposase domain-containing protein n=1 Tax=Dipteronia sinensis TaxID=43782 RepID=A0AAE0DW55_9ROSI|nr:hypothetical protein Dsin_029068 [Dipteronia sinensis]
MNDEQNNELYKEQNTEPNIEQNNDLNHEVDDVVNNDQVDDLEIVDEEPVQIQTRGRRVQGVSFTIPDMSGTSEVRHNVTASDSDNATTLVIPEQIYTHLCADDGKFLYFFMSLEPSIRGFRRCMRHVIAVDGTHLKGRFEGTIFLATAQDGNEQVYLIVFGYSDSENNLSWEWFLDYLKGALSHIDDLVFISDRHSSIESWISKLFPYVTHMICCRHNGQNSYLVQERNLDFTSLCVDYYKRETLIDAYSVPIMPVGHPSSWVVPSDIASHVVLNPKSKRQSGHPMEGRHASSL